MSSYQVVKSKWLNEDGEEYWTITDGVRTKGEFATKQEAIENMSRIILNWRNDT